MSVTLEAELLRLAPQVLRYCVGYTGDRALGEEVAQESLTALVKAWKRDGQPDHPDAFVFAVAKRNARRAVLRRRLFVSLDVVLGHRQNGHDPERLAIEHDRRERVLAAIGRLPPAEREAVLLVASDGPTLHEAATTLGISLSAMKMRYSRGIQRLRAVLDERHDR